MRFQRSLTLQLWIVDANLQDRRVPVTSQHRLDDQRLRQTRRPRPSVTDGLHGPRHSIDPLMIRNRQSLQTGAQRVESKDVQPEPYDEAQLNRFREQQTIGTAETTNRR